MSTRALGLVLVVAVLLGSHSSASSGQSDRKKKKPAEITEPTNGQEVERTEDVLGRLNVAGYPVILVRPLKGENTKWWIQPHVEDPQNGKFSGKAYFGDDETADKFPFRVVVVVAKSKSEAKKFKAGKALRSLPNLPKSDYVKVIRRNE